MGISGDVGPDEPGYDLFLCHSPSADGQYARRLQRRLERFAGTTRVFRADSDHADQWASIERALERSEWLALVASAAAAGSESVDRQLTWWIEHRSPARVLLVPPERRIVWDAPLVPADGHPPPPLPPALDRIDEEPPWTGGGADGSARSLDAVVVDIASTVRGLPQEELFGEHLAEHRHTLSRARTATAVLAALLVIAVLSAAATVVALNAAERREADANARQLAAASTALLDTHLDVAQLLAARAFRTDPSPENRATLVRASTANPGLTRFVHAPAPVRSVAGSDDGGTVLLGLDNGDVVRRQRDAPDVAPTPALPEPVDRTASDATGSAVIASGSTTVAIMAGGRPASIVLYAPARSRVSDVAMSPSGRVAAAVWTRDDAREPPATIVSLFDVASGRRTDRPHTAGYLAGYRIRLPADDRVVLVDPDGRAEQRRTRDGSVVDAQPVPRTFDPRYGVTTVSADGRFLAGPDPSAALGIWPTSATSPPPVAARSPVATPTAVVLNRSGSRIAVTDGGGDVHVVPAVVPAGARPAETTLRGMGGIGAEGLAFLGDHQLLSVSGSTVAIWDLRGGGDRLGRSWRSSLSCNGCAAGPGSPPRVSISHDGRRAALAGDRSVAVQPLDSPAGAIPVPLPGNGSRPTPVWLPDGTLAVAITGPTSPYPVDRSVPGIRVVAWPVNDRKDVYAAGAAPDGHVTLVTSRGVARLVDGYTGALRQVRRVTVGEVGVRAGGAAAVSRNGRRAAGVSDTVVIVDLTTGAVVGRVMSPAAAVAFAGDRLIIQRLDGTLELWDANGRARQRVVAGDGNYRPEPVVDPAGTLVARPRSDGTVDLVDLTTDVPTGRLPAVAGAPPNDAGSASAFLPTGRTLLTVTARGTSTVVTVRDLSDDALVAAACRTAGRDLAPEDWARFVGSRTPDDLGCR